ncbi:unnamed protein product [Urochloa humidicola]
MAASATIKDAYFHPQHMLASYNYSDLSTHTCAACERVVTGAGYSCDECDFNIHKACFSMPRTVSFANHSREHELTLTRITGSRFCDVCKETSHAGSYMYLCMPCDYDLHPRCVPTKTPMPVGGAQGDQVVVEPNNMGEGAGSSSVVTGVQVASGVASTAASVFTVVEKVHKMASDVDDDNECTIL